MKIVPRSNFLKLPSGTIYTKINGFPGEEISVKGATLGNSWVELGLAMFDAPNSGDIDIRSKEMLKCGSSYPLNDQWVRDGLFCDGDVFLIYERDDLLKLKGFVNNALEVCGESDALE